MGSATASLADLAGIVARTPDARVYIQPLALLHGPSAAQAVDAGIARPLAGGPLAFAAARVTVRAPATAPLAALAHAADVADWADTVPAANACLSRLTAPRGPFAGIAGPAVMGIVNVTPDSFSDGGRFADAVAAVAHGRELAAAGAAIIDVGGESTRPGADPVSVEEELRRVLPVVEGLAAAGLTVSIDTRRADVMSAALTAGAAIINDVTALTGDDRSLAVAADAGVPVILMHMRGTPRTMQRDPQYDAVALDVYDALSDRVAACVAAGIDIENLAVDPGIGFGKTVGHNLELLSALAMFHGLGVPLALGVSRKSFIGHLAGDAPPDRRLGGSLATALAGIDQGAQLIRAHDVADSAQAVTLWRSTLAV